MSLCTQDLVAGNTVRVSLAAMNLSPPTSRMTCLALALPPSALRLVMVRLGEGQWVVHYILECDCGGLVAYGKKTK